MLKNQNRLFKEVFGSQNFDRLLLAKYWFVLLVLWICYCSNPKNLGRDFVLGPLFFFVLRFWRFWDWRFLTLVIHHWKALKKFFHLYQGQLLRIICLGNMRVWNFSDWTLFTAAERSSLLHRVCIVPQIQEHFEEHWS